MVVQVNFRVLGDLEVAVDCARVPLGGVRQRGLVARMLLDANRSIAAEQLLEDVWTGKPNTKALQVAVARLREALGAAAERIQTSTGGYLIEVHDGELDLQLFVHAVQAGLAALSAGDMGLALERTSEALALWRGQPLRGLGDQDWALQGSERLEELRLQAIETRFEAQLALGRHSGAIPELGSLVAAHPDRERLRGQLMLALYRDGRQAEALAAFREARRFLSSEYGLEPAEELQRLHESILHQDEALTVPQARPAASPGPARSASSAPLPPRLRPYGPAQFVGRKRERELLANALASAGDGERTAVLVTGEPGVGKTRLVSEVAAEVSGAGALVLGGRCDERLELPYQPFVEALEHLVEHAPLELLRAHWREHGGAVARLAPSLATRLGEPHSEPSIPGEAERYALFAAIDGLLAATTTAPTLLVLEDIHWADAPTILLLRYLLTSPRRAQLAIVATLRQSEVDREDPAAALVADLHREPRATQVQLHGLTIEEVQVLAGSMTGAELDPNEPTLANQLHASTNGNPFFITELLRSFAETHVASSTTGQRGTAPFELPETVASVLRRRLDRVEKASGDVLLIVAATPGGVPFELLVTASDRSEANVVEGVEFALRAGVLAERVDMGTTVVDFVHPLFRQAMDGQTSAARRAGLHLRIADAIERHQAPNEERWLGELAYHAFCAGSAAGPDRVKRACTLAGDAAMSRTAFDAAADQYERALAALSWSGEPDLGERASIAVRCAEAYHASGEVAERRRMAEAAFTDALASDQPALMARSALVHGGARSPYGVASEQTVEMLDQSLEALRSQPDEPLRARVMSRLAQEHYHVGHYAPAERLSREAVALAHHSGDDSTLAATMEGRIWALHRPETLTERLELTDEMVQRAKRADDRQRLIWGLVWRCCAQLEAGRIDRVDVDLRALDVLTETLRIPSHVFRVMTLKTTRAVMAGDYEHAGELAQQTYAIGERVEPENARQTLAAQLLPMLREQNALGGLASEAKQMSATYTAATGWRCALAFVYLEADLREESRTVFEELAVEGFERIPRDLAWLLAFCYLAEVAAGLGDARRAGELYGRLLPYGERNGSVFEIASVGSVSHHLGLLARTAGWTERAAEHFRAAIAFNDRTGQQPAGARSRYEHARLLYAEHNDEAQILLAQALSMARELKLTRLVEQADQLARELELEPACAP